ncbi:unnamed protein product [Symbiodinium sp. KB8]|nr:unnamed protein product [Symbiodinium sp. KB8]
MASDDAGEAVASGGQEDWSFVETGRQLERQLATLRRSLGEQAIALSHVEERVSQCMTQEAHTRFSEGLDRRLGAIERRLEALEAAVQVPGQSQRCVGEAVAHTLERMEAAEAALAQRATSQALRDAVQAIRDDLYRQGEELQATKVRSCVTLPASPRSSSAHIFTPHSLKETTKSMAEQLSLLEGMVSRKVDMVSATVANIQEYETFQTSVSRRLAGHDEHLEAHDGQLASLEGRAEESERVGEAHAAQLETKALACQALARLDAVETMAGSAGTQEELLALQEALAKLEAAEAASKASVEASDRKMDRATCEALLRDLNRHVQARATVDEMREACGRLDQHQAAQRLLQEKVEVALAFVEWFGAKGETYEYNAAAMERHMNALARGNRASVRGVARAAPPRA